MQHPRYRWATTPAGRACRTRGMNPLREDVFAPDAGGVITPFRADCDDADTVAAPEPLVEVGAPDRNAGDLEQWLLAWTRRHLRDVG